MAFPTRSCASSAMVSRRSDRLDVSNPPSRLSMRAIRGPRLVRPGLVARTRGDARRLKTESSALPSLTSPTLARRMRPQATRTREALQNQLYLKPKPPGVAARGPTALGKTARTSLKVRRATTSRAPPSSFSSKRINPFRCRSIARPDPIRLPSSRRAPGQARPSPRPKASARRRRIGDPSHVRDCRRFAPRPLGPGGVLLDAPPPDGVIVLRLVPRAPRTSLDPR